MNRKTYALFITVVLIVTATTSIVAAEEIERIRFSALAHGPCFVLYGQGVEGGGSPFPDPIYYAGSGYGRARISGLAKDSIPYTSFLGEGYTSECVDAWSVVSVRWIENEGTADEEQHWLLGALYSSSTTEGFFRPDQIHEQQILTVPEPGVSGEAEALQFRGMHFSSSGIKTIKGFAVWNTLPGKTLFPECPNCDYFIENAYLNWLGIVDQDFGIYNLVWSELEVPSGICPFGTIPATESIQWNVEEA